MKYEVRYMFIMMFKFSIITLSSVVSIFIIYNYHLLPETQYITYGVNKL